MNLLLSTAAALAVLTGVVHSCLGERLIFRHLRDRGSFVPSRAAPPLQARHIRILWATWHMVSVLGGVLALILWRLASHPGASVSADWLLNAMAWGFIGGALLVLVGTRARHPGWIALAAIAVMASLGIGSR